VSDGKSVRSEMDEDDWLDVLESEFVDVARSEQQGDVCFIFEHDVIGLHGFRWSSETRTLQPQAFEKAGSNRIEDHD